MPSMPTLPGDAEALDPIVLGDELEVGDVAVELGEHPDRERTDDRRHGDADQAGDVGPTLRDERHEHGPPRRGARRAR